MPLNSEELSINITPTADEQQISFNDSNSCSEISSCSKTEKKFSFTKYCKKHSKKKDSNLDSHIIELHSRPPEERDRASKAYLHKEDTVLQKFGNECSQHHNSNKELLNEDSPSKSKKHRRRRNRKKNYKDNNSSCNSPSLDKSKQNRSSVVIDTKGHAETSDNACVLLNNKADGRNKLKERLHVVIDHEQSSKTEELDLPLKNSLPHNDSSVESEKLSSSEHCLKNQVEGRKKSNKTQLESRTSPLAALALSTPKCVPTPSNDRVLNLYLVKSSVDEENKIRRSASLSSLNKYKRSEVSHLVASALDEVYNSNRSCHAELVRQARDVLICCYKGNVVKFRDDFLYPVAALLKKLKWNERIVHGKFAVAEDGWPLTFNNYIVVHLGEADSQLKVGDFYLCVRKCSVNAELVLKYRSFSHGVQEHVIPEHQFGSLFTMDWLHSLHLESTSDEQLTTLLEYMLVAVEKGIDRIKWEMIARPCSCDHSSQVENFLPEKTVHLSSDDNQPPANIANNRLMNSSDTEVKNVNDSTSSECDSFDSSIPNILSKESSELNQNFPTKSNNNLSLNCDKNKKCFGEKLKTNKTVMVKDSSAQTSPSEEYKGLTVAPHGNSEHSQSLCPKKPLETSSDNQCEEDSSFHSDSKTSVAEHNEVEEKKELKENCLIHPKSIMDISSELIESYIAVLPGSRDCSDRPIVIVNPKCISNMSLHPTTAQVAQMLLYYQAILRKELTAKGLTVLIDFRDCNHVVLEYWDEVFNLVEGNISGAINNIVIWMGASERSDISMPNLFPKCRIKYEIVTSSHILARYITMEQLSTELGGTYSFDLNYWQQFRKKYEPFVEECRTCGRKLITTMQGLKGSRLPQTSNLTSQVIEDHKHKVRQIIENPQLVRLQKEGANTLNELEVIQLQQPHNPDFKDAMDKARALFNELHRATLKLSRLSEKRLCKLEQALQLRSFEEDASQILSWLCKNGETSLSKYKQTSDNLMGVRTQERDFEKFYFIAMRNIEKGNDLLEEANSLSQTHIHDMSAMKDLTSSLKNHLQGFSERLEDTRERLEDTSKFYQMLDKAYEWALEAMKFVSRLKMEENMTCAHLDRCMKTLQNYLNAHPPLADETFSDMTTLANKLQNEKFVEQSKVAQARCQETIDLIQTRQATFLKARIQSEVKDDSVNECSLNSESDLNLSGSKPSWTSTPSNLLFPFTRRRSIAVMPSTGYSPTGGYVSQGYSSFFRETYQLDSYISEHEESYMEDSVVPEYTSSSTSPSVNSPKQSSSVIVKQDTTNLTDTSSGVQLTAFVNDVSNSSMERAEIVTPHHSKPHKKYMRRSQTWQFESEPWQKGIPESVYRLLDKDSNKDFEKGSLESIQTLGTEDRHNAEITHSPSTGLVNNKICPPVSVNSHLYNSGSALSLNLSSGLDSEGDLSSEQIKHRRTLMLILSEMIQTERDYVKSLEYIIENYIPELLREDIPQALRGKRNVVFGNIEKIFEFHNQYFLQELEKCETFPFRIGFCFLKYERQFYLYALYNKNKPKSDDLMLEYGSAFFKTKQQELGDKMDLASYLLKPVQRMGKYALLLKQLLKECPEKHPEYTNLKAAEDMVKFQLRHGNDLLAMDCIRESDVDLKEQGRLLCQDEFLVFQGRSRKCLRHVFLFEDIIIFSKARRNPVKNGHSIYQYKNSVKMADIGLTERVGESNTKFEIWFRKCKINDTYTFQAPNADIKQAWVQEISKLLWKQALRNRELRLAEMSSMGIGNKPCLDIKPSDDQISDRSVNINQLAKGPKHRNSIAVMSSEQFRNNKRPHSIISVSSSSSGSSQSSYSLYGALNLGFDPNDSPNNLHRHRSVTQQSQCSAESGIVPDIGGYESFIDVDAKKKLERTGSNASAESSDTGLFTVSSAEEKTDDTVNRISSEA